MAPQRHRYTRCILFTGQRANKSNERVVCRYCSEAESPQWALQHALLCNTKKLVKSHLRRCRHFHAAQASGEDEAIVFTEDEDSGETAARVDRGKRRALVLVGPDDATAGMPPSGATSTSAATSAVAAFEPPSKRLKLPQDHAAPVIGSSSTTTTNAARQEDGDVMLAAMAVMRQAPAPAPSALHHHGAPLTPSPTPSTHDLERLLLTTTLANGWDFKWIDNPASVELLRFLEPRVALPSGTTLAGRVLQAAGEKEAAMLWESVGREKRGYTVVLDAWTAMVRERAAGVLLLSSHGELFVWEGQNLPEAIVNASNEDNDAKADVVDLVVSTLQALETNAVPVVAVISDSSPVHAKTRRLLRRERRDLMFLPCIAHQLQVLASDFFLFVPDYRETMLEALEVVGAVNSSQHFVKGLRLAQREHGISNGDLRLPNMMDCMALLQLTSDLLANKDVLKGLAEEATPALDALIKTFHVDSAFWGHVRDIHTLLRSIGRWLEVIIRQDASPLTVVPVALASIASLLQAHLSGTPAWAVLLTRIDHYWGEWEHPLMILAVVLNPALGWKTIEPSSGVTIMRLGCWARYYYQAFFGEPAKNLANEILEFIEGDKFWCTPTSIESFATSAQLPATTAPNSSEGDVMSKLQFKVVSYWKSCSTDCPELSKLALRVFSGTITAAGAEDLFAGVSKLGGPTAADSTLTPAQALASLRIRARDKHERRHAAKTPTNITSVDVYQDQVLVKTDAMTSSEVVTARSRFATYLDEWSGAVATPNDDIDVCRTTENENEAINSMYATIHPADDRFSKYSIQNLLRFM